MKRAREAGARSSAGMRGWIMLVALALGLRLVALLVVGHGELLDGEMTVRFDESTYHYPAAALAETGEYSRYPGGPPSAIRPPGAILPLAALYRVFGSSLVVGIAYTLACSVALVLVVRALALVSVGDAAVAATAGLIAACMPTLIWTATGIWSEPPALLLTVLALLCLLRRPERSVTTWAVAGVLVALAYLVRPSAVVLFPVLLGLAALDGPGRWQRMVVLAAAIALPILPWGIRNRIVMGEFFTGATAGAEALWGSNNPVTAGVAFPVDQYVRGFDLHEEARRGSYLGSWVPESYIPGSHTVAPDGDELGMNHAYVGQASAFLLSEPSILPRLLAYKLVRIVSAEPVAPSIANERGPQRWARRAATAIERWLLLPFGAFGLVTLYRSGHPAWRYYAGFVLAGVAGVLIAYANARMMLPVTVVLIVPAALGLSRVRAVLQGAQVSGTMRQVGVR